MLYKCPSCKGKMDVPDTYAGQKVQCPDCGQKLAIPPKERNKTVLAEREWDEPVRKVRDEDDDRHRDREDEDRHRDRDDDRSRRVSRRDDRDDYDDRDRRGSRDRRRDDDRDWRDDDRDWRDDERRYVVCRNCGWDDLPRRETKISGAGIVLIVIGIFFWPLIIVGIFMREEWDVCRDCGTKMRCRGSKFGT